MDQSSFESLSYVSFKRGKVWFKYSHEPPSQISWNQDGLIKNSLKPPSYVCFERENLLEPPTQVSLKWDHDWSEEPPKRDKVWLEELT